MNRTLALAAALVAACSGSESGNPSDGNDTIETATPLTLGTPVTAILSSLDDADFYAFTVPSNGANVRFRTFDATGTTCNGVDTYLEVYDTSGTPVAFLDDTLDTQGIPVSYCEDDRVSLATGGTAWVAVAGSVASSYTLLVTIP